MKEEFSHLLLLYIGKKSGTVSSLSGGQRASAAWIWPMWHSTGKKQVPTVILEGLPSAPPDRAT